MKKMILAASIVAGVIGLSACSNGSDAVVKSSAGSITKDDLYNAMKTKYGSQVLQQLVTEKVLASQYSVSKSDIDKQVQAAKNQLGDSYLSTLQQYGYANETDFRNAIKIGLLEQKAATQNIKVTDQEIQNYYNNYQPEIRASHILVADEKTANDIKAQLDKGADFATLAQKYSTDTASAAKGGDLGWFGQGVMDPDFEKAAYALTVNQISTPVKTQYGYHIIKLTGKKTKPSLASMKSDIIQKVKDSKVNNTVIANTLKSAFKKAGVTVEDKDLKNALDLSSMTSSTSGASTTATGQ